MDTSNVRMLRPDQIDFRSYCNVTEGSERVRPAADYITEMASMLGKPRAAQAGDPLPWDAFEKIRFRPGELTIWAGVNGHGKSMLSGMVAVDMVARGKKVAIASMEMRPVVTLERMLRQWTGYDPSSDWAMMASSVKELKQLYGDFAMIAKDRLWIYDQMGTVKAETMIGVARYCGGELGVEHIFIDSLMKCVRGSDDYNAQKDFVDSLCAAGKDTGMHIHLVHHIRKLDNELKPPGKMDIKGAGEITDQADNVLVLWRNKNPPAKRTETDPDAVLICDKQRNGSGWEGAIPLYFDYESQQFRDAKDVRIRFEDRCK